MNHIENRFPIQFVLFTIEPQSLGGRSTEGATTSEAETTGHPTSPTTVFDFQLQIEWRFFVAQLVWRFVLPPTPPPSIRHRHQPSSSNSILVRPVCLSVSHNPRPKPRFSSSLLLPAWHVQEYCRQHRIYSNNNHPRVMGIVGGGTEASFHWAPCRVSEWMLVGFIFRTTLLERMDWRRTGHNCHNLGRRTERNMHMFKHHPLGQESTLWRCSCRISK